MGRNSDSVKGSLRITPLAFRREGERFSIGPRKLSLLTAERTGVELTSGSLCRCSTLRAGESGNGRGKPKATALTSRAECIQSFSEEFTTCLDLPHPGGIEVSAHVTHTYNRLRGRDRVAKVKGPLGLSYLRDAFVDISREGEPLRIECESMGAELDSLEKFVEITDRPKGRRGVVCLEGDVLLYDLNAGLGVG